MAVRPDRFILSYGSFCHSQGYVEQILPTATVWIVQQSPPAELAQRFSATRHRSGIHIRLLY